MTLPRSQVGPVPSPRQAMVADRPLLLAALTKQQLVTVGKTMFGLDLVLSPTVRKETLREDIAAAMENSSGCGCSGISQPASEDEVPIYLPFLPSRRHQRPGRPRPGYGVSLRN